MSGVLATQADAHRPSDVLNTLKRLGFGAVVSVPDGWLGKMLIRIEHEPTMRLVRATHEEEALAIACGIRLGGIRTALLDGIPTNIKLATTGWCRDSAKSGTRGCRGRSLERIGKR